MRLGGEMNSSGSRKKGPNLEVSSSCSKLGLNGFECL